MSGWATGSYGAISGAAIAALAIMSSAATATFTPARIAGSRGGALTSSRIAQPRVRRAVEEIRQEIAGRDHDRADYHYCKHQRIVARRHGVHGDETHARPGKDFLDEHDTADQRG